MVSIVPGVQRHLGSSPDTVAQKQKAGERDELTNEINALILKHTGRKDLIIREGKNVSVMNLLKIRDALRIVDTTISHLTRKDDAE